MKHDSAVVTGSSREMGHFCDLGWGSSGFCHRVHSFFFLPLLFFLWFLESSTFLLISFGGLMKYCTSAVTESDSDLFSISELLVDIQFDLLQTCGDGEREVN